MSTLSISLSDDAREFIETEAASRGFPSPESYLQALVRAEQKRKARAKLEALLIEGLESGEATPMTDQDWADLRDGLEREIAKEAGS